MNAGVPTYKLSRPDDQRPYTPPWVKNEIERTLKTWRKQEATRLVRDNYLIRVQTMVYWLLPDETIKRVGSGWQFVDRPRKIRSICCLVGLAKEL